MRVANRQSEWSARRANPRSLAVSPDGAHLYVTCREEGTVRVYSIAPDGTLSDNAAVSLAKPGGLAFAPDGAHLYVATESGIGQYAVTSDGSLSALTPALVAIPGSGALALAMSADGSHLYSTTFADQVYQYAVGRDGTLGPIAGAPASVPSGPSTSLNEGIVVVTVSR